MIYFKKSFFGSIKRKIRNVCDCEFLKLKLPCFLDAIKFFFIIIFLLVVLLYLSYLFLFPVLIKEKNIEKIANDFLYRNTNFSLDIENLKIKPNYKFDINIKADSITLSYTNKHEFLNIKKINADVNLINLLFKQINLSKVNSKELNINLIYKNGKYTLVDCFKTNNLSKNTDKKFDLSGLKLSTDNLNIKLEDLNLKKDFYVNSNNCIFSYIPSIDKKSATLRVSSAGNIKTETFNFGEFNLNTEIKLKTEDILKYIEYLSKLNHNPLEQALAYKFNSKSDIDLKANLLDKNTSYKGKISLKDYSFSFNNIQIPKNNATLIIKSNKIYADFDFNFIKNQFIKIILNADISKNKYIEAKLNSNEINLEDLGEILNTFSKIFNFKGIDGLKLSGIANCNVYLKSDFKTIFSKGNLNIKEASVFDKKNNIKLEKINSTVNFDNNKILIKDTVMFLDKARLELSGSIDNKTNLNLKLDSDSFNLSDFIEIVKTIPFASSLIPELKEYDIQSGLLKITAEIKGNINTPLIKINSKVQNFKIFLKRFNTNFASTLIDISTNANNTINNKINLILDKNTIANQGNKILIPKLNLKLKDKTIYIDKTDCYFEKIPFKIEGKISDFIQNPISDLEVYAKIPPNNHILDFKQSTSPDFAAKVSIKNDAASIETAELIINQKQAILITGKIINPFENSSKIEFKNFKINCPNKLEVILKKFNELSLSIKGKVDIEGKISNPKINGSLNIYNLIYRPFDLRINDLIVNLNDSAFYLNIINSFIFNQDFNAIIEGKYKDNKLTIENAEFISSYMNYKKMVSYSKEINILKNNFEIKNFNANISNFEIFDTIFNSLKIEGNLKNNILNASKISLEGFTGQIQGSGVINLDTLNCTADLILKEISTRHLLNSLKELKDFSIAVSGKLSALLQIETNLNNLELENFINNSKIYAKFNINDGELAQFAKLERLLQAGNIISQSILKLSLNSIISTVTSKNTGDFKTIEGTIKLNNGIADIQYIKTLGSNMSLYMTGSYSFYNDILKLDIFGRIPYTIVNVMGNFGKFNTQSLVNKMSDDTKEIINSLTVSPFEKMMTTEIPKEKTEKIPPLSYSDNTTPTREFMAVIDGKTTESNPVKYFKWNKEQ